MATFRITANRSMAPGVICKTDGDMRRYDVIASARVVQHCPCLTAIYSETLTCVYKGVLYWHYGTNIH